MCRVGVEGREGERDRDQKKVYGGKEKRHRFNGGSDQQYETAQSDRVG